MGFWSTVLVALRLKSGPPPVETEPLHLFRVRVGAVVSPRLRRDAVTVDRLVHNSDVVHRTRVEAK